MRASGYNEAPPSSSRWGRARWAYNLTVALIAAALPLLGTTYYVDQTGGADGHDGTSPATAWRTASKVNRSTFAPGDQVLFKRGGLWRETLTIPSSGSVANPITFGAYGKGSKPTFYGASTVTGWSAGSGALFYAPWTFASNNVFQNDRPLKKAPSRAAMTAGSFYFEVSTSRLYVRTTTGADPTAFLIEASTNGPQWYGIIRALSKNNIVIQDLRVVKANYTGIYCEQCNNVVVRGNDIEQTFQNAITLVGNKGQLNSTNVTVEANTITDAGTGRGITGGGESECVGINAQGWKSGLVRNNIIRNQGGEGIQVLAGSTNVTVTRNKIVNPYATGVYVSSGWGNGGNVTNSTVSWNYVELGTMSISPAYTISTESATDRIDGVLFHHNIAKGKGTALGGLLFGAGMYAAPIRNTRVHHNVFVNDIYGVKAFGPTDDPSNTFSNNIIAVGAHGRAYWVGTQSFSNSLANYQMDYDVLHSPDANRFIVEWGTGKHYNLAQWRAIAKRGLHSIDADPRFTNVATGDYTLQSTSPAIDAGVRLSGIDQGVQGSAPDIGVYEHAPVKRDVSTVRSGR